jgi:TatD DNase family protein
MAVELHQNLFLHERLAFEDTTHILDSSGISPSKVIVHCFTGTMEECRQYVERGYWLSVSGWICRDDNNDDDGAAKNVVRQCLVDGILPLERLMVETDAPYMGFGTCRDTFFQQEDLSNLKSKKRKQLLKSIYPNVPSALPLVVQTVVDAINEGRLSRNEEPTTFAQVATITTANAIEFFSFPTPL